jgi:glycosyltransferase involved in cell wall biosynthesis
MLVHAYYLKDARVRRYAELLAGEGHRVDVLCLREAGEPVASEHAGVHVRRVGTRRRRGGPLAYLLEYASSLLRMTWRMVAAALRGPRYDVVHVHNFPNALVCAAWPQRLLGAKIVLDVHDPMPELFRSKFGIAERAFSTRLLLAEESLSLRQAHAAIAANYAFRALIAARAPVPPLFEVVMNAPGPDFRDAPAPRRELPGSFRVLYIGTLAERYGIETALEAIARLAGEGAIPGLHLSIIPKLADEGSYREVLERRVAELGIRERVSFLEPVPHAEMPAVIRGADVSVYTPLADVHMDIALSLKIPEVAAVGRPIVASRLSVLEQTFGEDALYLVPPGDAGACAEALRAVHRDPAGARARVARARERLEAFRWEREAGRYLSLLARLQGRPAEALSGADRVG